MNGGPSGFHHAPVTRTFVSGSALLSLLLGPRGPTLRLGLSYQDIFKKLRNWRLIASNFAFSSTPELLFGVYLLYYFRVFERQIGSNKHSVFILFSVFVSTIFEILALAYLKDATLTLASGPYGLIFASFVPFYFDIPVSSRFRIFSLRLTDKSFIYLAGLQLLFSSWNQSIVPGICGVLAGLLYRLNAFGVRRIKFPDSVAPLLSQISWPSLGSSSSILSNGNPMGSIPSYPGHRVEGNNSSAAFASVTEPLESSIATLVSMGFDRNSARQALGEARNDINAATNILLEMQP